MFRLNSYEIPWDTVLLNDEFEYESVVDYIDGEIIVIVDGYLKHNKQISGMFELKGELKKLPQITICGDTYGILEKVFFRNESLGQRWVEVAKSDYLWTLMLEVARSERLIYEEDYLELMQKHGIHSFVEPSLIEEGKIGYTFRIEESGLGDSDYAATEILIYKFDNNYTYVELIGRFRNTPGINKVFKDLGIFIIEHNERHGKEEELKIYSITAIKYGGNMNDRLTFYLTDYDMKNAAFKGLSKSGYELERTVPSFIYVKEEGVAE